MEKAESPEEFFIRQYFGDICFFLYTLVECDCFKEGG